MINSWFGPAPHGWSDTVWQALQEDLGTGDASSCVFDTKNEVSWYIEAEASGILCGVAIAAFILGEESADPDFVGRSEIEQLVADGDLVRPGTKILQGISQTRHLLSRERTALNFLMQLSGTATLTHQMVEQVKELDCRILDTRKTIPGLRSLQKYAVRCGGGQNHRFGLYDGIMLKDNHILAAGSITSAVQLARSSASHMMKIEVECTNLAMVEEAVAAKADIVMLDNFSLDQMVEAVNKYGSLTFLEASGGVTLDTVRQVAETGVDGISVGAITHSAKALSLHLEVV